MQVGAADGNQQTAEHTFPPPRWLIATVIAIQGLHLGVFRSYVGTYGDTAAYASYGSLPLAWRELVTSYQPLYPVLVRLTQLGFGAAHLHAAMAVLQMAAIVGACLLVYRITHVLTASRLAAAAAALLLALDVRITVYEYVLMTETLAILLSLVWLMASWQAIMGGSRWYCLGAAAALLALALLRSTYVSLVFPAALAPAVLSRFRGLRDLRRSLRRYATVMAAAAVLVAAKLGAAYALNGVVSGNAGMNLLQFLSEDRELVLGLPDGDPDVQILKQEYAARGGILHVYEYYDGPWGPRFNRALSRVYASAVARRPHRALLVALKGYYRQGRDNLTYCYPEESNHLVLARSRNPLLLLEKGLNLTLFSPWWNVPWSTASLLGAVALLFSRPGRHRLLLLGLLLGLVLFTITVTTFAFAGMYIADNCRMRLGYEAPLLAIQCLVAHRLVLALNARFRSRAAT